MGIIANKRSGLNVFRLQSEWARLLRFPLTMTRVDIKPIPHLAFGTAQVADWMVSVESGWFVLEDTKGTWLPDEFVINETTPLAPESAPGPQVWDALIGLFRSKADVLPEDDHAGRGEALAQLSWFAWVAGDDDLEIEVAAERANIMMRNPPSNPRDYDGFTTRLEELYLADAAAILRIYKANNVTQRALDPSDTHWQLVDAERAWLGALKALEALKSTRLDDKIPEAREKVERIRGLIRAEEI